MPPAQGSRPTLRLGQCHLRLLLGDTDITGHRHFQATAHGKSVDSRYGDPAKIRQGFKGLAKVRGHGPGILRVTVGEQVQVSTR